MCANEATEKIVAELRRMMDDDDESSRDLTDKASTWCSNDPNNRPSLRIIRSIK